MPKNCRHVHLQLVIEKDGTYLCADCQKAIFEVTDITDTVMSEIATAKAFEGKLK